jgi:hypothetical protein
MDNEGWDTDNIAQEIENLSIINSFPIYLSSTLFNSYGVGYANIHLANRCLMAMMTLLMPIPRLGIVLSMIPTMTLIGLPKCALEIGCRWEKLNKEWY